jgi:sugar lactone lactonase YvrE
VRWLGLDGVAHAHRVGVPVSAAIPRVGGGLVLCLRDAIATLEPGDDLPVERVALPNVGRLNDAKCDPRGRLWAGTMTYDATPGAHLHRVEQDWTLYTMLADVRISNGLGWSPDGATMFFADTPTGVVERFDYDLETGEATNRRSWLQVEPAHGMPDGLCVDAEGGVWLALWQGGVVRRYLPNGELDFIVELPVLNVTSCCFGGADLMDLYITTARDETGRYPHAGGLFRLRPGVTGLPTTPFAG